MTGGGMALRDELLGLLGEEGLAALCAARGGRRAYIPCSIRPGHWLAELLGPEAAGRLAFQYGGCRIDVPSRPPAASRDARIRELRAVGRSVAAIAAETGLSERQVRRILSR